MNTLCLLTTEGCHLCQQALKIIEQSAWIIKAQSSEQLQFEIVDIIQDEQLVELYGDKIPVILFEHAEQALFWPFDAAQLEQYGAYYLSAY